MTNMKPIPEYEGLYSITKDGRIFSHRRNKFMKPHLGWKGYLQVCLTKNGYYKGYWIHRLVANIYITPVDNKWVVNHINGIKTDNRVENLEWCTQAENIRHAIEMGLFRIRRGEHHPCAKFTDKQISQMIDLWHSGKYLQKEIGSMFGTSQSYVSNVVRGARRVS